MQEMTLTPLNAEQTRKQQKTFPKIHTSFCKDNECWINLLNEHY